MSGERPAIDPAIAQRIRLVGFDVDGTLTDGGLYIGVVAGERVEFKRFDIQDGMGLKLLQKAGLAVAFVTGRSGEVSRLRAEELKVDEFVIAGRHKLPALTEILERRGVAWDEVAFMGDDLIDIPVMERSGLPVAPGNAVGEVKAVAKFTTRAAGGHGAARELAEALLRAKGCWDTTVAGYVHERRHDD